MSKIVFSIWAGLTFLAEGAFFQSKADQGLNENVWELLTACSNCLRVYEVSADNSLSLHCCLGRWKWFLPASELHTQVFSVLLSLSLSSPAQQPTATQLLDINLLFLSFFFGEGKLKALMIWFLTSKGSNHWYLAYIPYNLSLTWLAHIIRVIYVKTSTCKYSASVDVMTLGFPQNAEIQSHFLLCISKIRYNVQSVGQYCKILITVISHYSTY